MTATNAGTHPGFDALYAQLYPSLLRYVDRLVGDRDASEDLAQEAFVRLLRRPDLEGEDARLWIFTVATNLVRDRGRATARRHRLLTAESVHLPASSLPDEELERAERIRAVRAALDLLPERDRLMLLMREEGFRYSEIAQALQVAPSSVGTLIARALKRFLEAYTPNE